MVEEALREVRKLVLFIDTTDFDDQQVLLNRLARLQLAVNKALQGMAIPDSYDTSQSQAADAENTGSLDAGVGQAKVAETDPQAT